MYGKLVHGMVDHDIVRMSEGMVSKPFYVL